MEAGAFGYVAGGAADEITLRANQTAFAHWQLRPRVLVDVTRVTTATHVLGASLSLPVMLAPTALNRPAGRCAG